MKWFRAVGVMAAMIGAVALTGCSSFHKDWKAATKAPIPANSIDGPWAGEWRSESDGHHGSLRCVVTKASETEYRAHFRAHYWKILHFSYAATLNGVQTNGVVTLRGESKLPKWAGGVYKYEGTATPTEFKSTYENKYDHGWYRMTRP